MFSTIIRSVRSQQSQDTCFTGTVQNPKTSKMPYTVGVMRAVREFVLFLLHRSLSFLMKIKGCEIKQGANLEGADFRSSNLQDANIKNVFLKLSL